MGWKTRKDKLQSDLPDGEATQDGEYQEPEQEIEADASAMARLAQLSAEPEAPPFVLDLDKDFRTDSKRTSLDPSEFAWFSDSKSTANKPEKPKAPTPPPISAPAYSQPSFDPQPFTPAPPPPYNRADYQSPSYDPNAIQQIPAFDTSALGMDREAPAAAPLDDSLQWNGPRPGKAPANSAVPYSLDQPPAVQAPFGQEQAAPARRPELDALPFREEAGVGSDSNAFAEPAWAQEAPPQPPQPTAFSDPGPAPFGAPAAFVEPQQAPFGTPAFAEPEQAPFAKPAFAEPEPRSFGTPAFADPEPAPFAKPAFAEPEQAPFGNPAFADPEPAPFAKPAFADPAPPPFQAPAFADPTPAPFVSPAKQNGTSAEPAWAQQPPQSPPPSSPFGAPPPSTAQGAGPAQYQNLQQQPPPSPPKPPAQEASAAQYSPSSTQSPYASQPSRQSGDGQNINSFSRDSVAAGLVAGEGELSIPKVAPFIVSGGVQQEEVITAPGDHYLILRIRNLSSSYKLTKDITTIGRPDSPTKNYPDIEIDLDDGVSRKHAEIRRKATQYYVVDVGSTNGTLLNGELMEVNVELKLAHGDRIRVGEKTEIVFE